MDRNRIIIRTSIIGIIANVFLAGFKAAVGLAANSIAVVLDAVNNLSDALSSVVTIIGTKLASKAPDKKHPLGHGRIEYLSTMIVAAIVLYAGATSFFASLKKIIKPVDADYSKVTLIVIISAIVVKLVLGTYVKKTGKKVNSGALTASGADALFDAVLSTSVLISAIIFMVADVSLEPFVGIIISFFIIKSGIEMLGEAVNEMLGKRMDREFLAEIRKTICENENVYGAYDLILHSYGPDTYIGSVHVEIPGTMSAHEIDKMQRDIAREVFEKHSVMLAGIGIYAFDSSDTETEDIRSQITKMAVHTDGILQIHGFYADKEKKQISFDIIVDFDAGNRREIYEAFCNEVRKNYPEYTFSITMDLDI